MNFNGLIRKFKDFTSFLDDYNFKFLKERFQEKVILYGDDFKTGSPYLGNSHWVRLESNPPVLDKRRNNIVLSQEEKNALKEIVSKIQSLLHVPYRVVIIQLVWLDAWESVPKHFDRRICFKHFKRFTIIINKAGMQYFVYSGLENKNLISVEDGDLFELNNRAYHELQNLSDERAVLVVFDFVEVDKPEIPQSFLVDEDLIDIPTDPNIPVVVWI